MNVCDRSIQGGRFVFCFNPTHEEQSTVDRRVSIVWLLLVGVVHDYDWGITAGSA